MATPSEKLAHALEALEALQRGGIVAIRARDLTRLHRERLKRSGFLQEVMKGWYIASRPDDAGESTAWYACYWDFCSAYLRTRFGADWCLSPEQSLSLHAGNLSVPRQLVVRSPRAQKNIVQLPYETSLLDVRADLPPAQDIEAIRGLRLFSLPAALIASAPGFFARSPTDARTALAMIRDASEILSRLLDGGHSVVAGRLAGAFRNIGRDRIADEILKTMRTAGYSVRESDPFETKIAFLGGARPASPYVSRIRLLWQEMRAEIADHFPKPPARRNDIASYLKAMEDAYVTDAYHSLSIEGYRVSPALIERVRSGGWNPDANEADREHRNALAARGYHLAFQAVKQSVERVLRGDNPGEVADDSHSDWYREMFAPSVTAGLLRTADLAGYRSGQVYIRRSKHVPPNPDAVRDLMPAFFDLLRNEGDAAVRVVLGHFVFVYIHPYMDGNGRMGRFLMNVMLAAGGYPWTVVPVGRRDDYMAALEAASVDQNIVPFAKFLAGLAKKRLAGKPSAKLPEG